MATFKIPSVNYLARDYETIRKEMVSSISFFTPEWTATQPTDFGVVLIELFSMVQDVAHHYIDRSVGEAFLPTALTRDSVNNLLKLIDTEITGASLATLDAKFSIATPLSVSLTIPKGTIISDPNSLDSSGSEIQFRTTSSSVMPYSLLTSDAVSGNATIQVASVSDFVVGDSVTVDSSTTAAETLVIGSIGSSSLTFTTNLVSSHATADTAFAMAVSTKVEAEEGKETDVTLTSSSPGTQEQEYLFVPDVNIVLERTRVFVNTGGGDIEWTKVDSLIQSGSAENHFEISRQDNGQVVVRFGDNNQGAMPDSSALIKATYIVSAGTAGNVGENNVSSVKSTILSGGSPVTVTVTNPEAASGGAAPQTISEARIKGPRTFRTLGRAVTLKDHEDKAEEVSGVSKSKAVATNFGNEVRVYIATSTGEATNTLVNTVQDSLDDITPANTATVVKSADALYARIGGSVKYDRDADPAVVSEDIESTIRTHFNVAESGFINIGKPLYISDLYNAIEDVSGVNHVELWEFDVAPYKDLNTTLWTGDNAVLSLIPEPEGITDKWTLTYVGNSQYKIEGKTSGTLINLEKSSVGNLVEEFNFGETSTAAFSDVFSSETISATRGRAVDKGTNFLRKWSQSGYDPPANVGSRTSESLFSIKMSSISSVFPTVGDSIVFRTKNFYQPTLSLDKDEIILFGELDFTLIRIGVDADVRRLALACPPGSEDFAPPKTVGVAEKIVLTNPSENSTVTITGNSEQGTDIFNVHGYINSELKDQHIDLFVTTDDNRTTSYLNIVPTPWRDGFWQWVHTITLQQGTNTIVAQIHHGNEHADPNAKQYDSSTSTVQYEEKVVITCDEDSDCPVVNGIQWVCINGQCTAPPESCDTDEDCPSGYYCTETDELDANGKKKKKCYPFPPGGTDIVWTTPVEGSTESTDKTTFTVKGYVNRKLLNGEKVEVKVLWANGTDTTVSDIYPDTTNLNLSLNEEGNTVFEYTLTGANFTTAIHNLVARVFSTTGNVFDMAMAKVERTSTKPTLTLTSPPEDSFEVTTNDPHTVTGTATDFVTGDEILVVVTSGTTGDTKEYLFAAASSWSKAIDVFSGENQITAEMWDGGNASGILTDTAVGTLLFGTGNPTTIVLTAPAEGGTSTATSHKFKITGTVNEPVPTGWTVGVLITGPNNRFSSSYGIPVKSDLTWEITTDKQSNLFLFDGTNTITAGLRNSADSVIDTSTGTVNFDESNTTPTFTFTRDSGNNDYTKIVDGVVTTIKTGSTGTLEGVGLQSGEMVSIVVTNGASSYTKTTTAGGILPEHSQFNGRIGDGADTLNGFDNGKISSFLPRVRADSNGEISVTLRLYESYLGTGRDGLEGKIYILKDTVSDDVPTNFRGSLHFGVGASPSFSDDWLKEFSRWEERNILRSLYNTYGLGTGANQSDYRVDVNDTNWANIDAATDGGKYSYGALPTDNSGVLKPSHQTLSYDIYEPAVGSYGSLMSGLTLLSTTLASFSPVENPLNDGCQTDLLSVSDDCGSGNGFSLLCDCSPADFTLGQWYSGYPGYIRYCATSFRWRGHTTVPGFRTDNSDTSGIDAGGYKVSIRGRLSNVGDGQYSVAVALYDLIGVNCQFLGSGNSTQTTFGASMPNTYYFADEKGETKRIYYPAGVNHSDGSPKQASVQSLTVGGTREIGSGPMVYVFPDYSSGLFNAETYVPNTRIWHTRAVNSDGSEMATHSVINQHGIELGVKRLAAEWNTETESNQYPSGDILDRKSVLLPGHNFASSLVSGNKIRLALDGASDVEASNSGLLTHYPKYICQRCQASATYEYRIFPRVSNSSASISSGGAVSAWMDGIDEMSEAF